MDDIAAMRCFSGNGLGQSGFLHPKRARPGRFADGSGCLEMRVDSNRRSRPWNTSLRYQR